MGSVKRAFLFSLLITVVVSAHAHQYVKVVGGQSEKDQRHLFPHRVLKAALDATVEAYGPYDFQYSDLQMSRNRALSYLKEGYEINVHLAPTRTEWEETVIPVRIPVRKGILSYRLLLINKSDKEMFATIENIEQLKELRAGLGSQWSTTLAMRSSGFNIVTNNDYEGLFKMLEMNRFDYFPRGINEVFGEMESRSALYPEMIIEETLILYLLTPSYFFVSPRYPSLAERIEEGLMIIMGNGIFDEMFKEEFGEILSKASLENRRILVVDNPQLSEETPTDRKSFWFTIDGNR